MTNKPEMIFVEPAESAQFVPFEHSVASEYVNYSSNTSVIPSSLDQIFKNQLFLMGSDLYLFLPE